MEIFRTIHLAVIAFACGIICTLLLESYIFKNYTETVAKASLPKHSNLPSQEQLLEELVNQIEDEEPSFTGGSPRHGLAQSNENLAINLTLQFLFNKLRNAERVRLMWLYRELNNEFKELFRSTTGRLSDVMCRDMNLGNHFRTMKNLEVPNTFTSIKSTFNTC
ncbi:hypothetical protein QAD02_020341 [Eretmocerus hayati]|uniref:Uncharacterized protein n=1 Tax=Eretmocerus hayati TaxID=131215 RepID=A0ACC2PLT2_9HYME|nr:hypothetical protein QAD02_020341 [Eretmocerus hayati]